MKKLKEVSAKMTKVDLILWAQMVFTVLLFNLIF